MEVKTLEDVKKLVEMGMSKSQALYYKLWLCMKKALADHDRLGCHCNTIALHLGRSVESGEKYYDALTDVWCDYFLS